MKKVDLEGSAFRCILFLIFRDTVDLAAVWCESTFRPGGFKRDDESIVRCNENAEPMVCLLANVTSSTTNL